MGQWPSHKTANLGTLVRSRRPSIKALITGSAPRCETATNSSCARAHGSTLSAEVVGSGNRVRSGALDELAQARPEIWIPKIHDHFPIRSHCHACPPSEANCQPRRPAAAYAALSPPRRKSGKGYTRKVKHRREI